MYDYEHLRTAVRDPPWVRRAGTPTVATPCTGKNLNETAGQSSAYAQGMADPQVYQEQMQTLQHEFTALRDISNQTHLQTHLQNQQLQEANRCANAQLQQWAEHSRLQAEQLAAFHNREVDPNPHGDAHGPRNLNKPGGRSIRFESCDGKNSETTKAWFAMSRTRRLATGIDPKTKDAVLHVASFFTGSLGRWWAATIRDVDDACGNFGSVAELEAAAMSLHYIRDPCRSAYNKLSKLKQTGSVHQLKQALEELHFHLPKRSARCKLDDFLKVSSHMCGKELFLTTQSPWRSLFAVLSSSMTMLGTRTIPTTVLCLCLVFFFK